MRPDLIDNFTKGIEKGISTIFQQCIGVTTVSWSIIAKERLRLTICLKRCGLRKEEDRESEQYLGATV